MKIEQANSETIFNAIKKEFEAKEIPYKKNMIGLGTDGAYVM